MNAALLPSSRASSAFLDAIAQWQAHFLPLRDVRFNYAYGDTLVAARYAGLAEPPSRITGEWQHGVVVRERSNHPDEIVGSDGLAYSRPSARYFVGRMDQVAALTAFGFSDVHAVGIPFAYVTLPPYRPLSESLLAMPAHGLPEMGTLVLEDYADFIADEARHFRNVVVCLHMADFQDDTLRMVFERRGIPVVCGADPADANAYDRVAALFCLFDVVTSNDFGSHIPYAALCGARVSIAGPPPVFQRAQRENLPYYRNSPILLDLLEDLVTSQQLQRSYPFLYVYPRDARSCRMWAAEQIGLDNRRTPAELRRLFGWTPMGLIQRRFRDCVGGIWDRARNGFGRLQSMVTG